MVWINFSLASLPPEMFQWSKIVHALLTEVSVRIQLLRKVGISWEIFNNSSSSSIIQQHNLLSEGLTAIQVFQRKESPQNWRTSLNKLVKDILKKETQKINCKRLVCCDIVIQQNPIFWTNVQRILSKHRARAELQSKNNGSFRKNLLGLVPQKLEKSVCFRE